MDRTSCLSCGFMSQDVERIACQAVPGSESGTSLLTCLTPAGIMTGIFGSWQLDTVLWHDETMILHEMVSVTQCGLHQGCSC